MSARCLLLPAVFLLPGAPLAPAPGGADKELAAALRKAAALDSYGFRVEEAPARSPGGAVECQYQKGRPLFCRADGIDFYRRDEVLVYEQGGRWQRTRRGTVSDPLRILAASAKVARVRLPHEELALLAGGLTGVKGKRREKGVSVYEAALTDEGVRKLAPSEFRGVARGGTARFRVNDDQVVVGYTLTFRLKGSLGNAEVDGEATRTVEIRDPGSTRVDPPAGAREALQQGE